MTSYSTLMRKARTTKDPAAKKRLVNKANKIRRATRGKSVGVRAMERANDGGDANMPMGINREPSPAWAVATGRDAAGNLPGLGEIVGAKPGSEGKSPLHRITDDRIAEVLKAARGKDDSEVGIIVRSIAMDGMSEGRRQANERNAEMNKVKDETALRSGIEDLLRQIDLMRKIAGGRPYTLAVSSSMLELIERFLTTKAGFRI